MPRPKKLNADYFPHDKHMRHHRKLKAIEAQFGLVGYAMWCKLLEVLTDCKHFQMVYNEEETELLAADWGVSATEISRFISFCTRLRMIVAENGVLYSPSLIETLDSVLSRREAQAERDRLKSAKNKDFEKVVGVSATETSRNEQESADCASLPIPAPKVKERKGKESKGNEIFLEKKESPSPFSGNAENGEGEEGWVSPEFGSDSLADQPDHRPEHSGLDSPGGPGQPAPSEQAPAQIVTYAEDSYTTANHTPTLDEVIEVGSVNGVPIGLSKEFFFYYQAAEPAWRIRGNDGVPRPFRWPYQLQKWAASSRRSGSSLNISQRNPDGSGVYTENLGGITHESTHAFPTIHTNETWHIWSYDKAYREWQEQYGNRPFPTTVVEKGWVILWDSTEQKLCFIPDKWAAKGYPTDRYNLHTLNHKKSAA